MSMLLRVRPVIDVIWMEGGACLGAVRGQIPSSDEDSLYAGKDTDGNE